MQRGRELTQAFYEGELDPVVEAFTDQMRTALGGRDGLATFRDQVLGQLGSEAELVYEQVTETAGHHVYERRVRFENAPDAVLVTWAFDAQQRVAGFSIRPEEAAPTEAPSDYLDYQTKTPLRLPFNEAWTVFWGGRTVAQNYHAAHVDQRFAYDLVVVEDGRSHTGEGRTNDDYHCYGLGVVAPGAGQVVEARDDLPDNTPGEMNPAVPPGNHVILDHGNGEYSFLAHLMQGSARVAKGDQVEAGDTLGLCGNSGNSSEPHLHYHLQDSADFGRGAGMPAMFLDYVADGEPVARGEPVQGQRIRPAGGARHPEPARE
jgi:murein DD-endopeptidase MepM/ murein hydrolase activator NlpD